jgi:EAL domain-containing protein (putative c-di-GMP-specific phosphodiesterase class I)
LAEGAKDLTVVKGIIALAEGLNIGVVAEGVENEEQARILRQLGCPMAQGFYFGKSFTALAAANTRQ